MKAHILDINSKPTFFQKQAYKYDMQCVICSIRNATQNEFVKDIELKKKGRTNEQLVEICYLNDIPIENLTADQKWNEHGWERAAKSGVPLVIIGEVIVKAKYGKGKPKIARHCVATRDGWLMDSLKEEIVPLDKKSLKNCFSGKKLVKIYRLG
jgi:hypothetical protein